MPEPQLSARNNKAKDLAHALVRRTGQPINRLVEQALERYGIELRSPQNQHFIGAGWELATEGRYHVGS